MCQSITTLRIAPAIIAMLLATMPLQAQKAKQSAEADRISSVIEQQKFTFLANWITDYQGNRRQLTPPYTLTVTSDSIECHLPYQGRLYSTPRPEDVLLMSILFTSKKYHLENTQKRTGWDIKITPEDTRNVQALYLSVASKGAASLSIRSADRDQVSYEGHIEPLHD